MSPSSYTTYFLIFILALVSASRAQLLSGDSVGFSKGTCNVGNTSLTELGITNFTTTMASDPLTWTIGIQRVDDLANSQSLWYRDYFLGTPPSVQLSNSSSVRSCALFFEGISSSLSFPRTLGRVFDTGTCNDALASSCVSDLMTQSQKEMNNLLTTSAQNLSESDICTALVEKLHIAPASCLREHGQGWGTILVRPLTGAGAAPIIQQGSCHLTTGKNYNVALVSNVQFEAPLYIESNPEALFVIGITPVMTIFYPYSRSSSSANVADIYLNCMKPVGSTVGMVGGGSFSLSPQRLCASTVTVVASVVVTLLLFL